jgi:hypothetical protein
MLYITGSIASRYPLPVACQRPQKKEVQGILLKCEHAQSSGLQASQLVRTVCQSVKDLVLLVREGVTKSVLHRTIRASQLFREGGQSVKDLVLSVREGVSKSVLLHHCHEGGSQMTSHIRESANQEGESISDVVTPSDRGEAVNQ